MEKERTYAPKPNINPLLLHTHRINPASHLPKSSSKTRLLILHNNTPPRLRAIRIRRRPTLQLLTRRRGLITPLGSMQRDLIARHAVDGFYYVYFSGTWPGGLEAEGPEGGPDGAAVGDV